MIVELSANNPREERIAYVTGRQSGATPADQRTAPVKPIRRDLGPNQLAWCRSTWPIFAVCERQVTAADKHKQDTLDAVRP